MLSTPKASAGRGRSSSLAGSSGAPTPKSRRRGTSTWRPGEELAIPRGNSFSSSMSRSRNSPIAALSSPKNGEGNQQLMMNRSQSEFSSTAGDEDNEGEEEDDAVHKQQADNEAATAARITLLQKLNVSKLPARVTTTPDHSSRSGNALHNATDETALSAAVSDTTSLASGGQQTAVAGVNATHHHPSSKQPPRGVEVTSTAASALRREYSSSVLARLAAAKQAAAEQADHDTGVEDDDQVSIVSAGSESRSKEDRKTRKSHKDQFVAQATPSVVGILPDGRHIIALDAPGTAAPATELGDTDAAIVGGPQGAEYFAMTSVGHPTVNMAKRTILSVPSPSLATRKKARTAAGMMRSGGGGGGGQKLLGSMGSRVNGNRNNSSSSSGGANILATVERQTQFLDSVTTQDTSTTVTTSEVKTPISVQNPDLVTTAKTIVQVKKTTIRTVTRSAIDGPTPVGSLKVTRERPRSAISLTGTGGGSSSATRPGSASLRQPPSIRSQSPATSDSRHRKGNGPADTIMTDLLLSPTLIDGIDGKQRESQFSLATEEEDDDNNSKEPKGFSAKAANPSTSSVVIRNYAPQGLSCTSSASGGGILNSDESGNSPSRGTQGSGERFLTTRQEVLLSSDVDQEEKEDPSTYHGKNPTTNILVRLEPRQSLENATSPLNWEGMHPHLQASLAGSSIRPRQGHPGLINGQIQQHKEPEGKDDIVGRRRRDHHQRQNSGKRTVASLGMGICHFPSGFGNKTKAKQLAQRRSSEQRFRF